MKKEFHMLQTELDAKALSELGKMLRLPLKRTDENYLVHCALSELFQDQAPQPFWVEEGQSPNGKRASKQLRVLAYSPVEKESLQELAKGFASPKVYSICDWERTMTKPMPLKYPEGLSLKFELRSCPVVRKSSSGKRWKKGQELDAYLSHVWELDDPEQKVDREEVYRNWLADHLEGKEAAELLESSVRRFSIQRMLRRTHAKDRKAVPIQRPDVTFSGTLKVKDPENFKAVLQNGIGRHKSFGFGMLRLRRA